MSVALSDDDLHDVREIQYAVNVAMSDHELRTDGAAMTPDSLRQLGTKLTVREIDDRSVARGMQGQDVMSDAKKRALYTAVSAAMFGMEWLESLLHDTCPLPTENEGR